MQKSIGIIGLGKMGANLARRFMKKGWKVAGYNRSQGAIKELEKEGMTGAYNIKDLLDYLPSPRIVWMMLPAGKAIDDTIEMLLPYMQKGDIIIDGGNSFYENTTQRGKKMEQLGVHFVDVGVSGGPNGALNGPSLMVGGEMSVLKQIEPLFADIAIKDGYQLFEGSGAGHFVKMVHNGIEYGMMQALAEGFALLKSSPYNLSLSAVAKLYNHGSVIESRLVHWLLEGYKRHGQELEGISGSVAHTGEGQWTIEVAKKMGIPTPVIEASFNVRVNSEYRPSYTGKILSMLRNEFGGHDAK